MMRVVWWIAYVLFLVTALGCATTSKVVKPVVPVVKSCAPPTSEFSALVLDTVDGAATVQNAVTEAEVLAAQTAVCTVTQIARDVLKDVAGIQLATAGPAPMRQQWAQAWVKPTRETTLGMDSTRLLVGS